MHPNDVYPWNKESWSIIIWWWLIVLLVVNLGHNHIDFSFETNITCRGTATGQAAYTCTIFFSVNPLQTSAMISGQMLSPEPYPISSGFNGVYVASQYHRSNVINWLISSMMICEDRICLNKIWTWVEDPALRHLGGQKHYETQCGLNHVFFSKGLQYISKYLQQGWCLSDLGLHQQSDIIDILAFNILVHQLLGLRLSVPTW